MTATTKLTERVGQMLKGRYRVHQVLHTGVRATVYAGVDERSGRVAIKIFDSAPDDVNVLRHSYLANAVGHPSAVNVLDTGSTEDGVAFLVMELLEATSMRQLLLEHEGHLPVRLACTIADQGLDLLASAHAQRIAHGEIELDKLFFTRTERVKVLGFGKPASEQATLDDVRALSKAIAWLVCGEPVDSLSASAIQPRLPVRIAAVLERGLTSDPAQRWRSANAMRTALQLACKAELGRPIDRSLQPLAATKSARPRRRAMWLAATGALVMALYVAREVAELGQVQAPESERETDITSALQPPQAKAQPDEEAPQQAAVPAMAGTTSHAAGQSSLEAARSSTASTASSEASPARHMPRKPNRPELRSLAVQRKSAIPTNIAPVSEVCAELSSARRARQLSDREAQVYLSRCTKH